MMGKPHSGSHPLLSVSDLTIQFPGQVSSVVDRAGFEIGAGACHGIVGESGSGKSLTAMAIVGLLPPRAKVKGKISFDGVDLLRLGPGERQRHRRDNVAVIFQDPMTALDPRLNIATQLQLSMRAKDRRRGRRWVVERSVDLLERVGISDPGERLGSYPFELSGGICQRVMIAMAIARSPRLLIADEPTTALDVSVQAQILDLIDELRASLDMSVLLISHELGVMTDRADTITVMRHGAVVEEGAAQKVLSEPSHDYTVSLLDAQPKIAAAIAKPRRPDLEDRPVLLAMRGITKTFALGSGRRFKALDGVDLDVRVGESFGIVGESGSGKSTLARIIVGLETADGGALTLAGQEPSALTGEARRQWRRSTQLVFQDPLSSLDPFLTVRSSLEEPLKVSGLRNAAAREERVQSLFSETGLSWELAGRRPSQLSGGQRQRVGIARALALGPTLIVADEPVSALDVSVQARILALLTRLREERQITQITISHDLAVIGAICDTVAVLYRGRLVERGSVKDVFSSPAHPYTRSLIAAIPGQGRRRANGASIPTERTSDLPREAGDRRLVNDWVAPASWVELGDGHGFASQTQTSSALL